jgi:hypothetical protein
VQLLIEPRIAIDLFLQEICRRIASCGCVGELAEAATHGDPSTDPVLCFDMHHHKMPYEDGNFGIHQKAPVAALKRSRNRHSAISKRFLSQF